MSRLRWYEIENLSPSEFTHLRSAISSRELKPGSAAGYQITSSNSKQIEGQFIKKFEYTEKVQDPFGRIFEIPVFGYDEVHFRILNSSPCLEIFGCPANCINLLVDDLYQLMQTRRAITEAHVDLLAWLQRFALKIEGVEVTLVSLVNVPVTNSISAKVILVGVEDVRNGIRKLLGNRKHTVERLQLKARFSGHDLKIELHAEGRASFTPEVDKMTEILRESLVFARKK